MSLRIAIDTGGTFTDVVAIDEDTGKQFVIKTPSTPSDPSIGLLDGVDKAVKAAGVSGADISVLLHGSTTATNAVLEHKFEGLGLIVTKGFRHLIEIARQSVPDGYGNSLFWVKPPRLVPLHLVREAPGRLDHTGAELEDLDETATLEAVTALVEQGVKCIGICLLHSYASNLHEERVGALISANFPDVYVSISSRVLPEYREYERAMTTLIDVMVKPYSKTYLTRAGNAVREKAGDIPFLIMQSNGGVVKHETAAEKPVTMLLSGPAGGVLGAVHLAGLAGYKNILTLDVGGTSTDMSLVSDLKPQMTSQSMIEHYPVKTPMLDIVTVGTGGGSLAWIDDYESLKVGPRSSGAVPGPICYRRGGEKPTVTDAAAVLGLLPKALVGGELELDIDAASEAYDMLGEVFDMAPEEVAAGVMEIATANMVNGIRQVTTTRGKDPSSYALVSFGGAGGLFAPNVAEVLDVVTVISPPNPGNLSAFGLHVCDVKQDYIRTIVRQQSTASFKEIESAWLKIEVTGRSDLLAEGVAKKNVKLARSADLRYVGEGHEVIVSVPDGLIGEAAIQHIWDEFHLVHFETFGFDYRGEQDVELVNLRIQAVGEASRPAIEEHVQSEKFAVPVSQRDIYWRGYGWVKCNIYDRTQLAQNQKIHGPTIVEEYGSTVVVPQNWTVHKDKSGNLILEKNNAG